MPMHKIGRKPICTQNIKSNTTTVIEVRFFMKKKKKKKMKNL